MTRQTIDKLYLVSKAIAPYTHALHVRTLVVLACRLLIGVRDAGQSPSPRPVNLML